MTTPQESIQSRHASALPADFPQPVSLETVAVIEQAFAQVLRGLREKVNGRAVDGTAEYESWLPPRH